MVMYPMDNQGGGDMQGAGTCKKPSGAKAAKRKGGGAQGDWLPKFFNRPQSGNAGWGLS